MPSVAPWRIGRGWSQAETQAALAALAERRVSFTEPAREAGPGPGEWADRTVLAPAPGWTVERFEAPVGREPPGPPLPNGPFARVRQAVAAYRFADPRLTHGTFDPATPLLGRDILAEVRVLLPRFLVGLRVGAVLDEADDTDGMTRTRFGLRLDTLEGHLLDGSEWVVVTKDHACGALTLRIEARWRQGRLPAWWMAPGFRLFGRQFQARWRRQAARRLRAIGAGQAPPAGLVGW